MVLTSVKNAIQTLFDRFPETVHLRVPNKWIATLSAIIDLHTDALEKQITDEHVKKWFDEVQDILFRAEDLLDEIHCKDRRLQVESGSGSQSNKIQNVVSSLFTSNREDSIKNLKQIIVRVKELEKEGRSLFVSITKEDPLLLWWRRGHHSGDHGRDSTLSHMKSRYREFTSDLKRCFVYCAVFPKGYRFRREELILLWLANGFLDFSLSNMSKKERGYSQFQEFVSSSIFVKVSDDPPSFILHESIYDWVKSISENYCVSLDENYCVSLADAESLFRNTRHIWCLRYEDLVNFERNVDGAQMRTILPMSNESFWEDVNDEEIGAFLSTFKNLRVLWWSNKHELPDSIGTMGHLRYLNLSGAALKKLPESVCNLFNLQTLILRQCRDLVELPANIVKLTELCHLDVRETRLQQLPPNIGKLRKLEMLTDFFVDEQNGCSIDELRMLWHLQGELHIWNLQNVSDPLKEGFLNKRSFKELELRWSGSGADDSLQQQDVLEELRPCTDVERLSIVGYGGKRFPDWVGHTSFSNIVDLKLSECHYCSSLPPLGQLSSLETLVVQAFYRVEKVGPEFYGSSTSTRNPFPSLKNLRFERMLQWREWESYAGENEDRAFQRLKVLHIRKCPNLANKTLPCHLPSLVELEITKCQRLKLLLPGWEPKPKMVLGDDFHKMVLDPRLQSLTIDSFHSLSSILEEIRQWDYPCTTLQKIKITGSPLESFPTESFPALMQLDIISCPNLESLGAQYLTSLERLELSECPKFKSMSEGSLPSSLIYLSMSSCPLLEQRCQRNTGADWTKISGISDIWINGHKIN